MGRFAPMAPSQPPGGGSGWFGGPSEPARPPGPAQPAAAPGAPSQPPIRNLEIREGRSRAPWILLAAGLAVAAVVVLLVVLSGGGAPSPAQFRTEELAVCAGVKSQVEIPTSGTARATAVAEVQHDADLMSSTGARFAALTPPAGSAAAYGTYVAGVRLVGADYQKVAADLRARASVAQLQADLVSAQRAAVTALDYGDAHGVGCGAAGAPGSASPDAGAKELARTALTTALTIGSDSSGNYDSLTPALLQQYETTIAITPGSGAYIVSAGPLDGGAGFVVTALSTSGDSFTVTHTPAGVNVRSCATAAGKQPTGCQHGTW
jgi:hypothetical protein